MATSDQLLVVIDPVARRSDGEAVRIAKDVLSGGATTKVCLPDSPEEFARALARRGSRRPVVVGDDGALLRAVGVLHRRRELATTGLSLVPVGTGLSLARSLGVPTGAVAAARAVLDGVERRLDLLVDDSDGVVLGGLRIPSAPGVAAGPGAVPTARDAAPVRPWLRMRTSLVRTLTPRPPRSTASPGPSRLRVEVDGVMLIDLDQPLEGVTVTPGGPGLAEVEVRPTPVGTPLRMSGRRVTVSGTDFRYRADAAVAGPVRTRTWVVREAAWGLTLPAAGFAGAEGV
ncbi:acylglycerol kinase family protein [Streptomyces sp. RY43-2]|uniref:Acylglycerol kinase family protein n=1 Tax=Streptomyces macrolidinus TaxID=2952607 RepID=A0ABT0ZE34_9ACTN|nr:acylglycerol kinase family protein [Streptomyces macrolidinus]MCN9241828.1 acylglycerol kinase family protein [Streptomyces macrolidinus]